MAATDACQRSWYGRLVAVADFARSKAKAKAGHGSGGHAGGAHGKYEEGKHPRDAHGHYATKLGGGKPKIARKRVGSQAQRDHLAAEIKLKRSQVKSKPARSKIAHRARELKAVREGKPAPAIRKRGEGKKLVHAERKAKAAAEKASKAKEPKTKTEKATKVKPAPKEKAAKATKTNGASHPKSTIKRDRLGTPAERLARAKEIKDARAKVKTKAAKSKIAQRVREQRAEQHGLPKPDMRKRGASLKAIKAERKAAEKAKATAEKAKTKTVKEAAPKPKKEKTVKTKEAVTKKETGDTLAARHREVAERLKTAKPKDDSLESIVAHAEEKERLRDWQTLVVANPKLIPPGHISDRLKRYTDGDAKVDALIAAENKVLPLRAKMKALDTEREQLQAKMKDAGPRDLRDVPGGERLLKNIHESHALATTIKHERDSVQAKVMEILKAKNPVKVGYKADHDTNGLETLNPSAHDQARKATDWMSHVTERGNGPEKFEVAVGAFNADHPRPRANCAASGHLIQVAHSDKAGVHVHELGHAYDYRLREGSQSAVYRSHEFLVHRVGNEQPISMKEKFGNFDSHEMGRKDKFEEALGESGAYYAGKDYGKSATEILSMGVQKLHEDPIGFAKQDREYCKYVLGMLDGSLR